MSQGNSTKEGRAERSLLPISLFFVAIFAAAGVIVETVRGASGAMISGFLGALPTLLCLGGLATMGILWYLRGESRLLLRRILALVVFALPLAGLLGTLEGLPAETRWGGFAGWCMARALLQVIGLPMVVAAGLTALMAGGCGYLAWRLAFGPMENREESLAEILARTEMPARKPAPVVETAADEAEPAERDEEKPAEKAEEEAEPAEAEPAAAAAPGLAASLAASVAVEPFGEPKEVPAPPEPEINVVKPFGAPREAAFDEVPAYAGRDEEPHTILEPVTAELASELEAADAPLFAGAATETVEEDLPAISASEEEDEGAPLSPAIAAALFTNELETVKPYGPPRDATPEAQDEEEMVATEEVDEEDSEETPVSPDSDFEREQATEDALADLVYDGDEQESEEGAPEPPPAAAQVAVIDGTIPAGGDSALEVDAANEPSIASHLQAPPPLPVGTELPEGVTLLESADEGGQLFGGDVPLADNRTLAAKSVASAPIGFVDADVTPVTTEEAPEEVATSHEVEVATEDEAIAEESLAPAASEDEEVPAEETELEAAAELEDEEEWEEEEVDEEDVDEEEAPEDEGEWEEEEEGEEDEEDAEALEDDEEWEEEDEEWDEAAELADDEEAAEDDEEAELEEDDDEEYEEEEAELEDEEAELEEVDAELEDEEAELEEVDAELEDEEAELEEVDAELEDEEAELEEVDAELEEEEAELEEAEPVVAEEAPPAVAAEAETAPRGEIWVEDEIFDPASTEELKPSAAKTKKRTEDWETWLDEDRPARRSTAARRRVRSRDDRQELLFAPRDSDDGLYERAADLVMEEERCSVAMLQRTLSVSFSEASALIERMHREGVVGPLLPSGRREILRQGGGRERAQTAEM